SEDAALQAILASRNDRPVSFAEDLPKRRIVDARRIPDCGNRVRGKTWVRKQFEVQGPDRGPGRVREARGARDSIFEAFLFELVQSFPEREEQGDGGRERGVLLGERVHLGLEIQVERRV